MRIRKSLLREQVLTGLALAAALSSLFYFFDWRSAALAAGGTQMPDLSTRWDDAIPFVPGWITIYLAYFPFCLTPLLFASVRRNREVFRRTAFGYASQFIAAFPFFLALPVCMVRPEIIPANWAEAAVAWFYTIDPGCNIFPSLHVANTAFLACLGTRLGGMRAGVPMWIFCLLTALSTLFVKQHYLVDLPAGFLLGVACFKLSFAERLVTEASPEPAPARG